MMNKKACKTGVSGYAFPGAFVLAAVLIFISAGCDNSINLMDEIRNTVQAATSPRYTLTVTAGTGGTVLPSGAVEVIEGIAFGITATPETGYVFGSWTELSVAGGKLTVTDENAASTDIVLTGGDGAVRADFLVELSITGFSPAADATNVNRAAPVEITFNKAINEASVTSVTFSVKNSTSGAVVSGTASVSSQVLTFRPTGLTDGLWEADNQYSVSLTTGITDTEGVNLDQAENWSFTAGSTVDNTPPTLTASLNGGETETDDTSVLLSLTATDDTSVEADMYYAVWEDVIGGGATIWIPMTGSPYSLTLQGDVSTSPQQKTVKVKVRDEALNESDTTTLYITLYQDKDIYSDSVASHVYQLRYVEGGDYYCGTQTGTGYDYAANVNETIEGFFMAESEVDYQLWYQVKAWAEANGYTFANDGQEGGTSGAVDGAAPSVAVNNPIQPVGDISFRDALAWCNALSEYQSLSPVYYYSELNDIYDAGTDTVFKTSPTDDPANNSAAVWSALAHTDRIVVDPSADGYRLPTAAEWQIAARGGATALGITTYGTKWAGADDYVDDGSDTPGDPTTLEVPDVAVCSPAVSTGVVKSLEPNELELYDMSGNMAEMVWAWDEGFEYKIRICMGDYYLQDNDGSRYTVYIAEEQLYPDTNIRYDGFRICKNR